MSHPDSHFRDKLYDLETPLGNRMSFDEVMRRRKSARRLLWWKPVVIVLAGLFTIAGSAYFYIGKGVDDAGKAEQSPGNAAYSVSEGSIVEKSKLPDSQPLVSKASETNKIGQISPLASETKSVSETPGSMRVENGDEASRKQLGLAATVSFESAESIKKAASLEVAGNLSEQDNWNDWLSTLSELKKMGLFKQIEKQWALNWNELQDLRRNYNMPSKSLLPDFVEFSMVTGGNGYRNFDEKSNFSVRGNHQFSQYKGLFFYSLPGDFLLGAGVISEWGMGAAQVRRIDEVKRMVVDTHTIVVIQPGLPPKTLVVRDTSMVTDRISVGSEVSYRFSKIAVPLAFRYLLRAGKGSVRLGVDVAPGIITSQSGIFFNRNTVLAAEQLPARSLSLDLKLSAGIQLALSSKTSVVAEPVLNMQRVNGGQWKQFNRTGLGFGLGFVYRL